MLPHTLPAPCHIFGDAHLGITSGDAELSLRQFLHSLEGKTASLVIMGDLFDFWFGWRHVMPKSGYRIMAAMADLHDAGVQVLWLGGNHDSWGSKEIHQLTGVHHTTDSWTGSIGSLRAHLAHGDGLRGDADAGYRRVRAVLRNPLAIKLYGWLHPDWATALALRTSKSSRHRSTSDEGLALLHVAESQLQQDQSLQLVVHGHSHAPMLRRVQGGLYANAGAWYVDPQYLRITGNRIERFRWTGSGEGDQLDVVDYVTEEPSASHKETIGRV